MFYLVYRTSTGIGAGMKTSLCESSCAANERVPACAGSAALQSAPPSSRGPESTAASVGAWERSQVRLQLVARHH